jgi:hypothetical protein
MTVETQLKATDCLSIFILEILLFWKPRFFTIRPYNHHQSPPLIIAFSQLNPIHSLEAYKYCSII